MPPAKNCVPRQRERRGDFCASPTPGQPAPHAAWAPRGSRVARAQCEVFGLRVSELEPFYAGFLAGPAAEGQLLEEYIAREAAAGTRWRTQLAMPPFTNALGTRTNDGTALPWL